MIALARVYSEAGNFQNTIKAVREGRKIKPGVAELSAIEGRIYKDTGDEDKAIAAFKRAITEGKGIPTRGIFGPGAYFQKLQAEVAGAEGTARPKRPATARPSNTYAPPPDSSPGHLTESSSPNSSA